MCNVSPKTSLLTSVKMLPSDHALCSAESRISAVGTVIFIHLLCSSALGFSPVVFLSHVNDLAAAKEKFSPGVFEQLSAVAFWALPVSEEQREGNVTYLALPPLAPQHLQNINFEGDVAAFAPTLVGFPRGRRNSSSFCQPLQKGQFPQP